MANFYMVPTSIHTGLNGIALGLVRACEQVGHRVSFFKPISQRLEQTAHIDVSTHFARELFHYNLPNPITMQDVEKLLSKGELDEVVGKIVENFAHSVNDQDVVIIEGLEPTADSINTYELNHEIANNLNAEIVFVVNCDDKNPVQVAEHLNLNLQENSCDAFGYVLNKLPRGVDPKKYVKDIHDSLKGKAQELICLGVVPFAPEKSARRMYDIVRHINASVIAGQDKLQTSRVNEVVVGARSAVGMADRFKPGALIVGSGDRDDLMMATALSVLRGVPLAGLILTNGQKPSDNCNHLIEPLLQNTIPILITQEDTYHTAQLISEQPQHIPHDDTTRMETMVNFVAENMNMDVIKDRLKMPGSTTMSPAAFKYRMIEQARAAKKRIVLPEGDEPRTIQAAIDCHNKGIAKCVLLAKREKVEEQVKILDLNIPSDLEIIDPDQIRHKYVAPLVEMRKSKGLTTEQAEQMLEDTVVIGTMMLAKNDVDGLVSGAVHTTANTIRPALQLIKTAPSASLVSSVFFMLMPDQVFVYGDCAVNPEPTAEQLADIAIQSSDSAKAFGIDPRVAMISYSTGTSGSGEDVEKVKEATRLAKEKRPDLVIDGPLQYDAASVPSVGRQKAPDSPVAGKATVFVFPDLNTGNTTYKAVQRSANVLSVGPMLQGLNKPVNDLSRGALIDDIVYTIALTAIQATQEVR